MFKSDLKFDSLIGLYSRQICTLFVGDIKLLVWGQITNILQKHHKIEVKYYQGCTTCTREQIRNFYQTIFKIIFLLLISALPNAGSNCWTVWMKPSDIQNPTRQGFLMHRL